MDTKLTVGNVAANSKDTILIADDMEMNREILAEYFKENYNILEAGNGIEVVATLQRHPEVNAVLLDLMMPGMDGIEVLKAMHETGDILHIPVFIVTASNNDQTLTEAYDLGAVDIISKPFSKNFFHNRVANIIELYRNRNEMESIIDDQIQRFNRLNRSMVETLASII